MGVGRSVNVQVGRLVFASSSSRDDRLGELLLRRGRVTLRQLADADPAVGPGKRLGAVLVERGILDARELVKVVVDHTREIIYGAFQWTEGHYRLEEGGGKTEAITLKMSTPDIILEGIRRIEAWSRIQRGVGGLATRYERAADYERVLPSLTLPPEKLSLLTSLGGVSDLESICRESTLPDFEACRTLWAYRVIGLVRRVDPPPAPPPVVEDEGLGLVLPEE